MAVTDHYATLGVARDADPEVVRAAYRALAKKYHPDTSPDKSSESSRRFRQISEAHSVLSDFAQRARYDESLENAARVQEASTRSSHQAYPEAKQSPPPTPAWIEAQREAVTSYLNGGRWTLVAEYVETESGKRADRPKLAAALSHAKAIGAKLVFAKLDRLTRNVDLLRSLVARPI